MSDGESDGEDRALARELERFCASDELSLEGLRERLAGVCFSDVENSSFFHRACLNKKVTLEMVAYILEYFPINAASMETDHFYDPEYQLRRTTAYPLHCACANESCPDAVLELLMNKCTTALSHLCVIMADPHGKFQGLDCGEYESDVSQGTPLHYYLARKENIDLGMVRLLTNACEEALRLACPHSGFTCLHTLLCNPNIRSLSDVLLFLVETAPTALDSTTGSDEVPLHVLCSSSDADPRTVDLLLNMRPESIRARNIIEGTPVHNLCYNKDMEESVVLEIYQKLIERDPGLLLVRDSDGQLPLHLAACGKSSQLCKAIVRSCPESLKLTESAGSLPLHEACGYGHLQVVEYLLEAWPESIGARNSDGNLPLHEAAGGNGSQKAKIIELLLSQDPEGAEKTTDSTKQELPLHLACSSSTNTLASFRILFNAYPEAIVAEDGDGKTPIDHATAPVQWLRESRPVGSPVVRFLKAQRACFCKAQKRVVMTTLDDKGWLPLHHALRDNATLGAVKLLLKGNPSAVHVPVGRLSFPLHLACQFSTAPVVKHLLELGDSNMVRCDFDKNTPLHYACRSGNCETAMYLLESHDPSVSERNSDDKLPIHLLCEAPQVNRRHPAYVETVWRLLLAHPETCRVE